MVAEEKENSKAAPKARNCAGLLYFSSLRKSQAQNPLCFGLSRAERNAERYAVDKFKSDPRALLNFKYACVGYSIYGDNKASSSTSNMEKHLDFPFCMGVEVLVEKRTASQGARDRHLNNKEDHEKKEVMPVTRRPPSSIGNPSSSGTSEEFGVRFIHSAGLVAGAVVKNLSKVGNSIKTAATDIFHSDRDRPK
eukprot:c4881_g1_i1 orf=406-987(-)